MRRRRAALVAGAVAGVVFVLRRSDRGGERVELFYEDGSLVTLAADEAQPLLDAARSALDAARA